MSRSKLTVNVEVRGRKKPRTFKVENNTNWLTNDLRAIIARVARKLDENRKPTLIVIKYSSKGHRGRWPDRYSRPRKNTVADACRLYLPRKADEVQPVQFAIAVYETLEFGSYRGATDDFRRRIELNQEYAWADTLGIRPKPPKSKPTADDKRTERRQRTAELIAQWEKKAKLAKTKLKKYRSRLRRYDRDAAKAGRNSS